MYDTSLLSPKSPLQTWLKLRYVSDTGPTYDMAVSLGPSDGVLAFNGMILPTWLVRGAKSRDMMVARYWKGMNQAPPK